MKTIFILMLSMFLMSCSSTTESLWKNSQYKEKIASFLISEDGKNLVIIGEKYHYIFDLDKGLKDILLNSNERKFLEPSFYLFKVDNENNISGNYSLHSVSKNEMWLKNNEFKKTTRNNKEPIYTFSGAINGKRYSTNKDINKSFSFNNPYYIKIEEPSSTLGNIGKILATPITVAIDGVKTASGIALATVFVGTMAILGAEIK